MPTTFFTTSPDATDHHADVVPARGTPLAQHRAIRVTAGSIVRRTELGLDVYTAAAWSTDVDSYALTTAYRLEGPLAPAINAAINALMDEVEQAIAALDAKAKTYHCPHCLAPMAANETPAGEATFACTSARCGKTVAAALVAEACLTPEGVARINDQATRFARGAVILDEAPYSDVPQNAEPLNLYGMCADCGEHGPVLTNGHCLVCDPDRAEPPAPEMPTVVGIEPAPLISCIRHIAIDRVALEAAYETAQAAHPDTKRGWGRAVKTAYEYLCEVWSDRGAVTFAGDVLLAESGSRPGVIHAANGSCSCEAGQRAREEGKECVCHHRARRQLLVRMLEVKAQRDAEASALADRITAARRQLLAA